MKILVIFSFHCIKLIILEDLISFMTHYISKLFYFGILNFKSFIMIRYVFKKVNYFERLNVIYDPLCFKVVLLRYIKF